MSVLASNSSYVRGSHSIVIFIIRSSDCHLNHVQHQCETHRLQSPHFRRLWHARCEYSVICATSTVPYTCNDIVTLLSRTGKRVSILPSSPSSPGSHPLLTGLAKKHCSHTRPSRKSSKSCIPKCSTLIFSQGLMKFLRRD